jgi:hypothetical protein
MKEKEIDLRRTVFELCKEYPELVGLLDEIGFRDIAKSGMLSTAGRFMTIPKGAAMKKIDPGLIKKVFDEHGFHVKE